VHKFDLLTYSRFTRTPTLDEGLEPSSRLHSALNILRVSRAFAGSGLQARAPERSIVTFGLPKMIPSMLRRLWSSGLCSCAINRHLRPLEGDPFDALHVVVPRLVLLSDRPSPSVPKVGFPVLGVLVGTDHPSGALVTQHRSPTDRLGDVFEAGINLRAHSRRSNPQQ